MATEFRPRLRDPNRAQSATMETSTRPALTETSAALEREPVDMSAPAVSKSSRPSIRPSAFGIPRSRGSDPAEITTAVERLAPAATHSSSAPPASEEASNETPPVISQVVRKRPVSSRPVVKTDIEELLPISQGVKSLPLPPLFPTADAPQSSPSAARRFPWMSLSIFAVVVTASLVPLVSYRGERTHTVTSTAMGVAEVDWSSLAPLARDLNVWGEPASARDALLDEGERALAAQEPSAAEGAFVRALAFGIEDAQAAFGLARVHHAQGDIPGARGWAELAMQRKPDEQRYRAFISQLAKPARTR